MLPLYLGNSHGPPQKETMVLFISVVRALSRFASFCLFQVLCDRDERVLQAWVVAQGLGALIGQAGR